MSAAPGSSGSSDVRAAVLEVLGPFNETAVTLEGGTRFTEDLNFDSLLVMEFIAALEDRLDISVPLNVLPDIETVGQLVVTAQEIVREEHG